MNPLAVEVEGKTYVPFTIMYEYRSHEYGFQIMALGWEDAEARLVAIAKNGRVDGEVFANIKVPGPFQRFVKWLCGIKD